MRVNAVHILPRNKQVKG
uniref:Uncharacterized protein n=1 Tax=Anguilla anguilla TaxID=7936 RepID=A0A0E9S518_ANGAN